MASFNPCCGGSSRDTAVGLMDVGPLVPESLKCALTLTRSLCFYTFVFSDSLEDVFFVSPRKTWISVEPLMGFCKKQPGGTQVLEDFPLQESPSPS